MGERSPDELTAKDILEYVEYLRRDRHNGSAAVNRQVTILRNFYRAMVAMDHLDPKANPTANFPKIKAARKKLPVFLSQDETRRLLHAPRIDTVLGLRDRALLCLLYASGIRASECAGLTETNVDLADLTIRVMGKGGNERCIPLFSPTHGVFSPSTASYCASYCCDKCCWVIDWHPETRIASDGLGHMV